MMFHLAEFMFGKDTTLSPSAMPSLKAWLNTLVPFNPPVTTTLVESTKREREKKLEVVRVAGKVLSEVMLAAKLFPYGGVCPCPGTIMFPIL